MQTPPYYTHTHLASSYGHTFYTHHRRHGGGLHATHAPAASPPLVPHPSRLGGTALSNCSPTPVVRQGRRVEVARPILLPSTYHEHQHLPISFSVRYLQHTSGARHCTFHATATTHPVPQEKEEEGGGGNRHFFLHALRCSTSCHMDMWAKSPPCKPSSVPPPAHTTKAAPKHHAFPSLQRAKARRACCVTCIRSLL